MRLNTSQIDGFFTGVIQVLNRAFTWALILGVIVFLAGLVESYGLFRFGQWLTSDMVSNQPALTRCERTYGRGKC